MNNIVRIAPSQEITPSLWPHYTPSEQITPSLLHHFSPLTAQLLHHFTPSEKITPSLLHHFIPPPWQPNSYIFFPLWTNFPLTLTPFYPLLYGNFSQGSNPWKVRPLQSIAAHSYKANLVNGGNSSKIFPLQRSAAHSYIAISVRG